MAGKVLVLGGSGFLGAAVANAFRRSGAQVEVCSRRTGLDARDERALAGHLKGSKPDLVVHAAAHVGGIAYNAQCPVAIFEDNLLLGFAVIRAARSAGIKLVNIMPNCTYPGQMDFYREDAWWDGPLHETVLTYGIPRKALWMHAWACQKEQQLSSIHLVLPNLYGPRDHFDAVRSHALGALVRKIVDAKRSGAGQVEIWGSGSPVREWMYVEDAAEGIAAASERYSGIDVLNLGCGKGCSIHALAILIAEAAGWTGQFVFDASRPDGAPVKILDTTKMKAALGGWSPATPLREGIARTVAWYERHCESLSGGPSQARAASR